MNLSPNIATAIAHIATVGSCVYIFHIQWSSIKERHKEIMRRLEVISDFHHQETKKLIATVKEIDDHLSTIYSRLEKIEKEALRKPTGNGKGNKITIESVPSVPGKGTK